MSDDPRKPSKGYLPKYAGDACTTQYLTNKRPKLGGALIKVAARLFSKRHQTPDTRKDRDKEI